jgi:hypothetical protein
MNERIKELAIEAERQIYPVTSLYNEDSTPRLNSEFEQKFAELIVGECLMKAIGAKIRGESIDTLIQNIKEDFGVEE